MPVHRELFGGVNAIETRAAPGNACWCELEGSTADYAMRIVDTTRGDGERTMPDTRDVGVIAPAPIVTIATKGEVNIAHHRP